MGVFGDIRDVLRRLRHKRPSRVYCPKCASSNIHPSGEFDTWLVPVRYVCENCGYAGSVVMELEKDEAQQTLS